MLKNQFHAADAPVNEIRYLGNDPESCALATRACEKLFPPSFEDSDQAESLTLPDRLCDNDDPANNGQDEMCFSVIGNNLGGPDEVIKGLCVGQFFPNSGSGALWYLAVDKEYRREGLGGLLVRDMQGALERIAHRQNRELTGTFAHIEDPAEYAGKPNKFDPAARVRFYAGLAAMKASVNFVHPVSPYNDEEMHYMLLCVPDDQGRLPAQDQIAGHIDDYYKYYEIEDPAGYPAVPLMREELKQADRTGSLFEPLPLSAPPNPAPTPESRHRPS